MRHQDWLEEPYEDDWNDNARREAKWDHFCPADGWHPLIIEEYKTYVDQEDDPVTFDTWIERMGVWELLTLFSEDYYED